MYYGLMRQKLGSLGTTINVMFGERKVKHFIQRRRKIDNWRGVHIHIFVFTDCENN